MKRHMCIGRDVDWQIRPGRPLRPFATSSAGRRNHAHRYRYSQRGHGYPGALRRDRAGRLALETLNNGKRTQLGFGQGLNPLTTPSHATACRGARSPLVATGRSTWARKFDRPITRRADHPRSAAGRARSGLPARPSDRTKATADDRPGCPPPMPRLPLQRTAAPVACTFCA